MNLGKSITDFSAEGDEDKDKAKEDLDQDDDHEKLDEEMGECARHRATMRDARQLDAAVHQATV